MTADSNAIAELSSTAATDVGMHGLLASQSGAVLPFCVIPSLCTAVNQ